MTVRDEQLQLLRERNPFASSSAGDPWQSQYPDVSTINKRAFDGIARLLEQTANEPYHNAGALVLGEVGSGKTHLIGRILRATARHPDWLFAYINPIEDPGETHRYLLREVFVNLLQPAVGQSRWTQLHRLVAAIVREFTEEVWFQRSKKKNKGEIRERLANEWTSAFELTAGGVNVFANSSFRKYVVTYLLTQQPLLSRRFLQVLMQYPDPNKSYAAINWLKGELIDTEDADILGVKVDAKAHDVKREQQALGVLESTGTLLARYHRPMLVCFDRLENLDTDDQVHALGKMLELLVDRVPALLPVAFFRGSAWEERFRLKLNQHISSRLETNQFPLENCTVEQALDLIRTRLAFAFEQPPDKLVDLSPLDIEALKKRLQRGAIVPRYVIAFANEQVAALLDERRPAPAMDPLDRLQQEFEAQYQSVLADFDRYEPDRGRLRAALSLYVSAICTLKPGKDSYVDLVGKLERKHHEAAPLALIIDMQMHHRSVYASLDRALELLKHDPAARVVYIRDRRRCIPGLPKWPATNAKLKKFKQRGGFFIELDRVSAARWYALALLHYAVTEGDVTVVDADGRLQSIDAEALRRFVTERLCDGGDPAFVTVDRALNSKAEGNREADTNCSDSVSEPVESERTIEQMLFDILRPLPMMMANSSTLVQVLAEKGLMLTREALVAVVVRNSDRFETIHSKDGVLVLLKKEWLGAQD